MRVFTTSKGVVAAAAAVQVDLARRSQNGQILGAARVASVVPQLRQVGATQRPVEGACFGGDRQVVDLGSPSRRRPKVLLEVVDRLVRLLCYPLLLVLLELPRGALRMLLPLAEAANAPEVHQDIEAGRALRGAAGWRGRLLAPQKCSDV